MSVDTADRDLSHLQPFFGKQMAMLIARLEAGGMPFRVTETLRSFERSDWLFAQGRTRPGSIVTHAGAGASRHNYGLALDMYPAPGGKINLDFERDPKLLMWAKTAAQWASVSGISWGGNWTGFKDFPHFEIPAPNVGLLRKIYPSGWKPGISKERAWL